MIDITTFTLASWLLVLLLLLIINNIFALKPVGLHFKIRNLTENTPMQRQTASFKGCRGTTYILFQSAEASFVFQNYLDYLLPRAAQPLLSGIGRCQQHQQR